MRNNHLVKCYLIGSWVGKRIKMGELDNPAPLLWIKECPMRTRIFSLALACVLAFSMMTTPLAWADGAVSLDSTKADVNSDGVTLSSDNLSAIIEGCAFAVGDFERASKGSNRELEGKYYGYAYYIGSKANTVMYLVTDDLVMVYVDDAAAKSAGFDISSKDDLATLQKYLVALDTANANGNASIPTSAKWYFTSERVNELDGVVYAFNQEVDDSLYNWIVGADGSDITDSESPNYTRPSFACFGSLVAAKDAVIVAEPSAVDKFGSFMTTLDWSPLWVTLKTTFTAIVFIFILGLAAAYFCMHRTTKFRNLFDTIFTIPMVLPPTVCGFLLLLALGSNTPVGKWFIDIGFPLIFSWPATVIAAVVVAFPLMYRGALGAFDNLDPNMLDAARTLGWSESKIFFKIMLPLSWSSIAASTVLAFARALGEFGATLFLAGNYLGITRTIPIAIYFEWMNGNTDIAIFWTIILVIFSFLVIMFINLWSQHTTRYRKGAVEE